MKRILVLVLAATMILSLTSCGKIGQVLDGDGMVNTVAVDKEEETKSSKIEGYGCEMKVDKEDDYGTITFYIESKKPILYDGWLGFCPVGEYASEVEADDADVFWVYPEYDYDKEDVAKENGKYVYVIDIYDEPIVEPGKYTMVICNTDYEGEVVMQWTVGVKADGSIVIDEDSLIVNENAREVFEAFHYEYDDEDWDTEDDEYDDEEWDENWDVEYDEEDEEYDLTGSSKTDDLFVTSSSDLVCVENEILVAKYVGTAEDMEEDSTFVDDYGQNAIYYVWEGFDEEGNLDQVFGRSCLYYFFDDQESYEAALDEVPEYAYRAQNDEYLYITVRATEIEGYDWEECTEAFRAGDNFRYPHFELVE